MNKIIWICWFQGRENAPYLIKNCISSWESQNPDWEVRCLDATTISKYLDLDEYINLNKQVITAASASDILRVLLLHEYGGVWADSTLFCNQPLSEWLPPKMSAGFFAFSKPGPDRMLASWFLASTPDNPVITKWAQTVVSYWKERSCTKDYFWLHHSFTELYSVDESVRALWESIPKISADGPHSFSRAGMLKVASEVCPKVDWAAPLFKLTHRVDTLHDMTGTLLDYLFNQSVKSQANKRIALQKQIHANCSIGKQVNTLKLLGSHIDLIMNDFELITRPKRIKNEAKQSETFIISNHANIKKYLPNDIVKGHFIKYAPEAGKTGEDLSQAIYLMELYSEKAKLIVTTSPHCALYAVANGIPVVVFYQDTERRQSSGLAVFKLLNELIRVFSITEVSKVDWKGYRADISNLKLSVVDFPSDKQKNLLTKVFEPLAPASELPVGSYKYLKDFIRSDEHLTRIGDLKIPDRLRWGMNSSYDAEWDKTGELAAQLVPDCATVFEVGTGLGWFKSLVSGRCHYVGADLEPLDSKTFVLNLDSDTIPIDHSDYIVLLGVLEYLHKPLEAISKLKVADNLIVSYCCRILGGDEVYVKRQSSDRANHFSESKLLDVLASHSFKVVSRVKVSGDSEYEQLLFKLIKIEHP